MHIVPISVDVETSGAVPSLFNLLQLGACPVLDPDNGFQMDLKPVCAGADPEALAVTGMTLEHQAEIGEEASAGMTRFAAWVDAVADGGKPVFVGLAAAYDWQFVNRYFIEFVGRNPFGFAPIDLKALFMGKTGLPWTECSSSTMDEVLGTTTRGDHTALGDARYQAELYRLMTAAGAT